MSEIAQLVYNYGASALIIGMFIYDWLNNKNKIQETLEQNAKCLVEMNNTNNNTSKSLELLQKTIDNQQKFIIEHDNRCKNMQENIIEIKTKLEGVRFYEQ